MAGQSSGGTVNLSAENEDLKVSAANSVGMYYSDTFVRISLCC